MVFARMRCDGRAACAVEHFCSHLVQAPGKVNPESPNPKKNLNGVHSTFHFQHWRITHEEFRGMQTVSLRDIFRTCRFCNSLGMGGFQML